MDEPANLSDKDFRTFRRAIQWAVGIALALMGGFIAALRQVNPETIFKFDWITVVGILFGLVMGVLFWKVLPSREEVAGRQRRVWMPLAMWSVVLVGGMVFGFAYSMKDLSSGKQWDMIIGTAAAFMVLGFVGFLFIRIAKFFEEDHQRFLEEERERLQDHTDSE